MTSDLGTSWLRALELILGAAGASDDLREQNPKSSGDGDRKGVAGTISSSRAASI